MFNEPWKIEYFHGYFHEFSWNFHREFKTIRSECNWKKFYLIFHVKNFSEISWKFHRKNKQLKFTINLNLFKKIKRNLIRVQVMLYSHMVFFQSQHVVNSVFYVIFNRVRDKINMRWTNINTSIFFLNLYLYQLYSFFIFLKIFKILF